MPSDEPKPGRRHSIAAEADLISDPVARAELEARNGIRQFDLGQRIVEDGIAKGERFRFRPSHILALHRQALEGLSMFAGGFRPAGVAIEGSRHEPVGAHLVPELVEELCDYVNLHWVSVTALHLAAYVMWRLNWIHPFIDGNGRTSRVSSYVVLCLRLGFILPGRNTIPDQIVSNRTPYFAALEAADAAWRDGRLDVSLMEDVLQRLLAVQLADIYERATSKTLDQET